MSSNTIDERISTPISRTKPEENDPEIIAANFDIRRGVLFMQLSDGRRLFVPREELHELRNATDEQMQELFIVPSKTGIWWPQLDDGIYLPDFLERRWHKAMPQAITIRVAA
jgi:hypothetical protein